MDIKKLKYNRELMKTKIKLTRELTMVEKELKHQQASCNHIAIYLEKNSSTENICLCLLCREKYTTNELKKPFIDAWWYRTTLLRRYDEEILLNMLQNQCIEITSENSDLPEEEMIEKLNQYLTKEKNKVIQTRLNMFNRRKD